MLIERPTPAEHAEFLALVDAEIRPGGGDTRAWDDFPLILDPRNRENTLIARPPDGPVAAGISCLVRDFRTNGGLVTVAGIGSVVTAPAWRGRGLSRKLQEGMLGGLRRQNIPLAVLWTDKPAIYAGRGFAPAGWEHHVDLRQAAWPRERPMADRIRPYRTQDAQAVGDLYLQHPYVTIRQPGDGQRLYGMPGTTGLVLAGPEDRPLAAVFCGKGADFAGYVTEWDGPPELVLPLLERARDADLAHMLLCPAGGEALLRALLDVGAGAEARTSGLWAVLDPGAGPAGAAAADPAAWLGTVTPDGRRLPGRLELAVWGFDSV